MHEGGEIVEELLANPKAARVNIHLTALAKLIECFSDGRDVVLGLGRPGATVSVSCRMSTILSSCGVLVSSQA